MDIERAIIRGVPLFARLDDAEIERLAGIITVKGCIAGVPLFEAGDEPDAFYVVSKGSVRIQVPSMPDRKIVLGRGDFFGEMGVIRGTRRSADAIVAEDSVLLKIARDDFDDLMALDPVLAEKIIGAYLERTRQMTAPEDPSPKVEKGGYVAPDRKCRVVTIFSPSGGMGTTTLACSMAVAVRNFTSSRVLVVDGDLQFGSVHLALSIPPGPDSALLARESEISGRTVGRYVRQLHYGVDVLPSPLHPPGEGEIPATVWRSAVNNLTDKYDYVIIDAASGFSALNEAFFELSDDVFVVLAPEVVSVNRVLVTLDHLKKRGIPDDRVKLLLNRYREEGKVQPDELEKRFGRHLFGRLTFDPTSCIDALNEGVPLVKRTPRAKVAVDLSRAVRQLLCLPAGVEEPPPERSFSLWNLFT